VNLEKFDDRRPARLMRRATASRRPPETSNSTTAGRGRRPFRARATRASLAGLVPDAAHLAYATVGRKSTARPYSCYDPAKRELINLSERVVLPPWSKDWVTARNYTWKFSRPKFGGLFPAVWLPDGRRSCGGPRGALADSPRPDGRGPEPNPGPAARDGPGGPGADPRDRRTGRAGRLVLIAKDRESRSTGS